MGTDAHARLHLNAIHFGVEIISRHASAMLLNTLSNKEIKDFLKDARKLRASQPVNLKKQKQGILFKNINVNKPNILASISSKQLVPDGSVVVGFDLTASHSKKTGVAKLTGKYVETTSLRTDEELIDYIIENNPAIVSIDSPLGLPGGGEYIDKDAGIVRVAEHDLSSVGISAYPALIDSMKKLTLRGIKLRREIESFERAPIVIESYPGAAQDILSIPRKQRGLALLRSGLRDLGIIGPGLDTTSHDEMDAITSALVGRYFESGCFEPMGIPLEAQLIVPRVQILDFERPPIIAVSGKTGAGKSVVSRYLALNYGFYWIKTREIIKNLLLADFDGIVSRKLGYKKDNFITEKVLRDFGRIIMQDYGQSPLRNLLTKIIKETSGPVVVDSIRTVDDLAISQENIGELIYWHIETPDNIINTRWNHRGPKKQYSINSFKCIDRDIESIRQHVNYEINNSGTYESLFKNIDRVLFKTIVTKANLCSFCA